MTGSTPSRTSTPKKFLIAESQHDGVNLQDNAECVVSQILGESARICIAASGCAGEDGLGALKREESLELQLIEAKKDIQYFKDIAERAERAMIQLRLELAQSAIAASGESGAGQHAKPEAADKNM